MITFEQVRDIIGRELGVETKEIHPTTAFASLTDSLERASLLLELENELGIEIPEDDAQRIIVVQDVVTFAGAN